MSARQLEQADQRESGKAGLPSVALVHFLADHNNSLADRKAKGWGGPSGPRSSAADCRSRPRPPRFRKFIRR